MLPWIIQISIISLILIILVHYLFTFFKTNLTIPKVKDLVNKPMKQYEILFDTMKETNNIKPATPTIEDTSDMKNELKNYLKELSSSKKLLSSNNNNNHNHSNYIPSAGPLHTNELGGMMTGENVLGLSGSMSSNSYSTF